MAMAMQRIHKGARCTIGPWIERGFYYDFDMPEPIADKDLNKIRKEMQKIIRKDLPFVKEEVGICDVVSFFNIIPLKETKSLFIDVFSFLFFNYVGIC